MFRVVKLDGSYLNSAFVSCLMMFNVFHMICVLKEEKKEVKVGIS